MTNRRHFLLAAAAGLTGVSTVHATQNSAAVAKVVRRQKLEGAFAGMEAVVTELTYPPGGASGAHRHGGLVIGYVIEGEFRFAINGEAPVTVRAGETFYEPPGAQHTTSANASADKPAKLVVTIIVPEGAAVTSPL
jgi:quercetin dioxygenase-like cupin family protein